MAGRLIWRGAEIEAKLEATVPVAIDEVTAAAAERAQSSHWWQSHGHLVGQIVSEAAHRVSTHRWAGKFGSTQRRGFYGLILEYREPFLRPAGDEVFPTLIFKLRSTFSR